MRAPVCISCPPSGLLLFPEHAAHVSPTGLLAVSSIGTLSRLWYSCGCPFLPEKSQLSCYSLREARPSCLSLYLMVISLLQWLLSHTCKICLFILNRNYSSRWWPRFHWVDPSDFGLAPWSRLGSETGRGRRRASVYGPQSCKMMLSTRWQVRPIPQASCQEPSSHHHLSPCRNS